MSCEEGKKILNLNTHTHWDETSQELRARAPHPITCGNGNRLFVRHNDRGAHRQM